MKAGFVAMLFQRINSGTFFVVSTTGKVIDESTKISLDFSQIGFYLRLMMNIKTLHGN